MEATSEARPSRRAGIFSASFSFGIGGLPGLRPLMIALSIRLPLQQIMAAMQAITSGDYDRQVQGTAARDEVAR